MTLKIPLEGTRFSLRTLVFNPSNYNPNRIYPLHINFHGGGFCGGHPEEDSEFCRYVASTVGCVVWSSQYRFAPDYPFPTPHKDVHAVFRYGLETQRYSAVSIGGFSAGATLVLSSAQLNPKPAAVIAFYPPCDFSVDSETTIKGDPLRRNIFIESYLLKTATDELYEPLLSPRYARIENLPESILVVIPKLDPNVDDMRRMVQSWQQQGGNKIVHVEYNTPHGWNYVPSWIPGIPRDWVVMKWDAFQRTAIFLGEVYQK